MQVAAVLQHPMHQRKPQQGRKADQTELIPNVTHAALLFMHNLPMPQARAVLVGAICENLRFLPSKIPDRKTVLEIP